MDKGVDHLLAELAGRQHGVVARWQLIELGVSRRAIETRLSAGRLHRVHQGVYAVGHVGSGARFRWSAAVLAAGPNAVLSHRSAAELWGLRPNSSHPIEVTRPRCFRTRAGIKAHHSRLLSDEVTKVDGVPVTTVPRTLFDLASVTKRSQVESALNEADVRGLTDTLALPDLLARYPGHRGVAVLRKLLAHPMAGVMRGEFEERFAALLEGADLPRPRLNADLWVGGRFFNVDALWAEQRAIVELDGRAVHGTRRAFERDREKDRLLHAEGWRVVRVTWRQLRDDAPAVVADLRRMLRVGASTPTL